MQLRFGPHDGEAFEDAREQVLKRFRSWADGLGLEVEDDPVHFLLDAKFGYLDGHPTRWRVTHIEKLLTEIAPRKLTADDAYLATVVPALRAFLRHLADTGHLAAGSDPPGLLDAALDRLEAPFHEAMGDPSRFGPAKALATVLGQRGVDLNDADAVQRVIDEINALPFEERAALLPAPPMPDPEPAPPVVLPDARELAVLAQATTLLDRLRTVVAFYGDGRKLTSTGNPTVADGGELAKLLGTPDAAAAGRARSAGDLAHVMATVELTRELRLVKRARGVQSATRRGRALDDRPLEAWSEAFDTLLAVGPTVLAVGLQAYRGGLVEGLESDAEGLLELLYRAGDDVPVEILAESFAEVVLAEGRSFFREDVVRNLVAVSMDELLEGLALAGTVEKATGTLETDDGEWEGEVVRLAPLGRWHVRGLLLDRGEPAPLAGELAGEDAATLLTEIGRYPVEVAQEEIRQWIAARDLADAVAELAGAIRAADGPLERNAAAGALIFLPDTAEPAIRVLRDDPLLRPYATLWLIDRDLEPPTALSPGDQADQLVETLAAVLIAADPAEVVAQLQETATDPRDLLDLPETIRRVDSPHTDPVLTALADAGHPALAKAARKALFKRRSTRRR